jgi:3-hydroxy-3-methylglutaryl CoA synthase/uncharacterized OB-fold protein
MAPGLRSLAQGHKAIAHWDEDTVTMAVEAVRSVLPGTSESLGALHLVSTTLPFAERLNAGIVSAALGLSPSTFLRDAGSSARAATTELIAALQAPATSSAQVVVAAERRTPKPASAQEMLCGDGAAAVLVGRGALIARCVGTHTEHADFVDHFRESGQMHDYGWEERWTREEGYLKIAVNAIQAALARHGLPASAVDQFVMPAPLPKVNEAVAKRVGIPASAVVSTQGDIIGDLGSAQPLAMLDHALRQASPGALIALVAFGSGCDVLLLRRTELACPGQPPGSGKSETSYLKYLSFTQQIDLEWGMRAEMDNKTALTAAWRDHGRVAHFEGGTCQHCGTLQFPAGRLCVNPACQAQDSLQPTSLVDVPARVLSHTSDFLAYTPHPPFQFGHIDFEGGARVLMEFADTDDGELQPGLPVRMVYRIKEFDAKRGFRRYFWKATPVRSAT